MIVNVSQLDSCTTRIVDVSWRARVLAESLGLPNGPWLNLATDSSINFCESLMRYAAPGSCEELRAAITLAEPHVRVHVEEHVRSAPVPRGGYGVPAIDRSSRMYHVRVRYPECAWSVRQPLLQQLAEQIVYKWWRPLDSEEVMLDCGPATVTSDCVAEEIRLMPICVTSIGGPMLLSAGSLHAAGEDLKIRAENIEPVVADFARDAVDTPTTNAMTATALRDGVRRCRVLLNATQMDRDVRFSVNGTDVEARRPWPLFAQFFELTFDQPMAAGTSFKLEAFRALGVPIPPCDIGLNPIIFRATGESFLDGSEQLSRFVNSPGLRIDQPASLEMAVPEWLVGRPTGIGPISILLRCACPSVRGVRPAGRRYRRTSDGSSLLIVELDVTLSSDQAAEMTIAAMSKFLRACRPRMQSAVDLELQFSAC